MRRDDIIRMAREAGMPMAWISVSGVLNWSELQRFAALVAAAEREHCAKVCDMLWNAAECAEAIRARSNP
jgi:hypothetical protein